MLLNINNIITMSGGANGAVKFINVDASVTAAGGDVYGVMYDPAVTTITGVNYSFASTSGVFSLPSTVTPAGTTGNQTINKQCGTVNIAATGSSAVVTNSLVTVNSIIDVKPRTNDATAWVKNYVPASGSFTINLGAAATAETSIGFCIITR